MGKLTAKQKLFVQEYVKDKNGARSARAAGFAKRSAREQAVRLLANVSIAKQIENALTKQLERSKLTGDMVIARIKSIALDKKKVRDSDALKGCELLGKHFKLFTDVSETNVKGSIETREVLTPEDVKEFKERFNADY
jgi:hypothetical protein